VCAYVVTLILMSLSSKDLQMYMDRLITVVLFSEHKSSVNLIMFVLFQKYGFIYCLRSSVNIVHSKRKWNSSSRVSHI